MKIHTTIFGIICTVAVVHSAIAQEGCGEEWSVTSNNSPGSVAICYDEARNEVITQSSGKLWAWNGISWTERWSEPALDGADAMAYDRNRQVCYIFGGAGYDDRLWKWDGTALTLIANDTIGGRGYAAMAFDWKRDRLVVHGGQAAGQWLYSSWGEWDPATNTWQTWNDGPIGRLYAHKMVYDSVREVCVLHGGYYFYNRNATWTWNGATWLNLTNTGNVAITNFDASAIVNNNSVDRLVLGGTLAVAATTDTAANLAVTFASANTTTTATVSIKGGAGNDVLTGNASIDTITGGAGADQVTGGLGADTIVVGSGHDIVVFVSDNNNNVAGAARFSDSSTAATDSITGYTLSSAITAVDLVGGGTLGNVVTAFGTTQATAGGDNLAIFAIDMDDTGNGGGNTAIAVEANATALAGQAAGVTYTVTNGILTLGGVGAGAVDTLGEWLTEAAAVAATAGDILAFQFGSDTYIFGENGGSDVFIKLVGVTGAAGLVEASAATTAAAGSIIFADIA